MSNATDRDIQSGALFTEPTGLQGGLYIDEDGYPILKDSDGNIVYSGQGGAKGVVTIRQAITGYTSTGVKFGIANPFGQTVVIQEAVLVVTTVATGAATVDIGVAANATTGSDTLIDGKDVNAATGAFNNVIAAQAGTNGRIERTWGASEFVTLNGASGDLTGLVGYLRLTVTLATS